MLRLKGYLTFVLCISLAFFLLSSSIVSSFRIDSIDALATSEVEGDESTEQQNAQENEQASDDGGGEQSEEGQQENGIIQEPPLVDVPSEAQLQEGQPIACSGVVNPETGECEEIEQPQGGSAEICDNSVDDDLDGSAGIDDSDCFVQEGQEASVPPLGSNALPSDSTDWGLPQDGGTGSSDGNTEIPSFGPASDSQDTTTSASPIPSFSPLTDSEIEDSAAVTESISREGMMPSSPPAPPTSTGPGDLIAPPSASDPDFCLKEFGRVQITGEPRSPQCMQGQNSGDQSPSNPEPREQPVPAPPTDQLTDPQPADLAQLCSSLTIQTVTDLDCTQFQPNGVQPLTEPPDQTPTDQIPVDGPSQQQPQPQPAPAPPPSPPDQSSTSQPKLASSSNNGDSDLIPDSIKNNICFKVACGAVLGLVDSVMPDRKSQPPILSEGLLAPKADTTVETTRGGTEMVASAGQIAAGLLAIGKGLGIGSAGIGGIAAGGTATAGAVIASPALALLGVGLVTWGALSWLQGKQTRDDAMQMAKSTRGSDQPPSGGSPPMNYVKSDKHPPPGTPPFKNAKGEWVYPEPTNPKDLQNSLQIKDTSPRRVSVNQQTGEIAVWDKTRLDPNTGVLEYHGHMRPWNIIKNDPKSQDIKNFLMKEGLVDKKGRPIAPPEAP